MPDTSGPRDGRAAIINHARRYAGCDPSTGKSIVLAKEQNTYVVRVGYQKETMRRGIGGTDRYWRFSETLYAHPGWSMAEEGAEPAVQPGQEQTVHYSSSQGVAPAEWWAPPASSYPGQATLNVQIGLRKRMRLELEDATPSSCTAQVWTTGFSRVPVLFKEQRATVDVHVAEQDTADVDDAGQDSEEEADADVWYRLGCPFDPVVVTPSPDPYYCLYNSSYCMQLPPP